MTQRSVSLKAGLGAGYVNSLVKEGKDPAVDHVLRICAALDVSAAYILFGFNVTPETERIMRAVEDSPERRKALRSFRSSRDMGRETRPAAINSARRCSSGILAMVSIKA